MDEQKIAEIRARLTATQQYFAAIGEPDGATIEDLASLLSALGALQDAHECQRLHLASALERMNAAEAERDQARVALDCLAARLAVLAAAEREGEK